VRPAATDAGSVLVVWPPQATAPEHVSLVARGEQARDDARAAWFAEDDAQREQEDWNLLYVAATRARQVLIVSGAEGAQTIKGETWYTRMAAAQALSGGAAGPQPRPPSSALREMRDFRPGPMPTGRRVSELPDTDAQRLGRAWHALLELGESAAAEAVARSHGLSAEQRTLAVEAAARVRRRLPQFFQGSAVAEMELISAEGELLRVDRLAEFDDALWIIDFKWRVTEAERAQYEAQVRRYAQVLQAMRSDKRVQLALVTSEGQLIEVAA
jgi:ATP-dependent helicase/nuclease subunit A